jgi:hypothetical protein
MHIADLFLNPQNGNQLRTRGYTIIPLLDADAIAYLKSLHAELEPLAGVNKEFYTSIWSNNEFYRKAVNDKVEQVLFPALQKYIENIQPVFSIFMVKAPGDNSSLLPHQDWSFVDEPEFDSVTVWVPLTDVDQMNGNLQAVPGSHLIYKNYIRARFAGAPFNTDAVRKDLRDIPMKAGDALIINDRLIHASPPNNSSNVRLTSSIVIAPKEADLFHWIQTNGTIRKVKIDSSFFWKYSCFDNI